jgi:hypothetical protein
VTTFVAAVSRLQFEVVFGGRKRSSDRGTGDVTLALNGQRPVRFDGDGPLQDVCRTIGHAASIQRPWSLRRYVVTSLVTAPSGSLRQVETTIVASGAGSVIDALSSCWNGLRAAFLADRRQCAPIRAAVAVRDNPSASSEPRAVQVLGGDPAADLVGAAFELSEN